MKRYALPLLFVVLALLGGAAGFLLGSHFLDNPPARAGVQQIERGEIVPDFQMPDIAGEQHALSQWHGRWRIVNYWASWCPPCIEEMPMLNAFARRHSGHGVSIIGIAEDDPDAVRTFLREHPVEFPILLAQPGQLAGSSMQLGNSRNVLPFTVLIGPDGKLLERHVGAINEAKLNGWLKRHPLARLPSDKR